MDSAACPTPSLYIYKRAGWRIDRLRTDTAVAKHHDKRLTILFQLSKQVLDKVVPLASPPPKNEKTARVCPYLGVSQATKLGKVAFLVKSSFESTNLRKYPRRPLLQQIFARVLSCGHEQLNGPKSSSSSGKNRGGRIGSRKHLLLSWGLALNAQARRLAHAWCAY